MLNIAGNNSSLERNDWPFRMLIIGPSGSGKTNTITFNKQFSSF